MKAFANLRKVWKSFTLCRLGLKWSFNENSFFFKFSTKKAGKEGWAV